MEINDINFLIAQGKRSTEEFLKHFGRDHNLPFANENESREIPTNASLTEKDLKKLKCYC